MSRAMSLLIAGTVAIDNIITPAKRADNLLGGSASYAALAASVFHEPVDLLAVAGADFPEEHLAMLKSKEVRLEGLERSSGESFTWTGEYAENMNHRETLEVGLNVLEAWEPKVHPAGQDSRIVVLANMSPANQLQTMAQCPKAGFVIADTMDLWINIAREELDEVISKVGLFVLNEEEATLLTGTTNILKAGEKILRMGPEAVAIKLGEHGSFLFGKGGEVYRAATYPPAEVVDPTGAGDSYLGGAAGFLANRGKVPPAICDIWEAVVRGGVIASFTCEDFSTRRLETVTFEDFERRLDALRDMTRF